jgi:hypothetical protein
MYRDVSKEEGEGGGEQEEEQEERIEQPKCGSGSPTSISRARGINIFLVLFLLFFCFLSLSLSLSLSLPLSRSLSLLQSAPDVDKRAWVQVVEKERGRFRANRAGTALEERSRFSRNFGIPEARDVRVSAVVAGDFYGNFERNSTGGAVPIRLMCAAIP